MSYLDLKSSNYNFCETQAIAFFQRLVMSLYRIRHYATKFLGQEEIRKSLWGIFSVIPDTELLDLVVIYEFVVMCKNKNIG